MGLTNNSFTKDSTKNFLLNAAAIYTNVTYTPGTTEGEKITPGEWTGTKLGATAGGVSVKIEQSYRVIEVDGTSHMKVMGLEVLESAFATATAKVKEFTAELVKSALNGTLRTAATDEAPTGTKIVETKRYIEESDYIKNVGIVGKLSGSNEPVIFILDNALATNGLELETEDNSEAVVEQTYEAHASYEQFDADTFPWRIYFPAQPDPAKAPVGDAVAQAAALATRPATKIEAPTGPEKTKDTNK